MARNDPFTPAAVNVASSGTTSFDGSGSGTGAAIVSGLYANFDAELYIEDSADGGSTWNTVTQLTDDAGNLTFTAPWSTTFNRLMVKGSSRRIRVDNVDTASGYIAIDGDER